MRKSITLALASTCLIASSFCASALDNAEFYAHKDIKLVVAAGGSGRADDYGRLVAKHFARHLSATTKISLQLRPGNNGLIAANYMASAPNDGSVIALLSSTIASYQILNGQGVAYDAGKLNYIGRLAPIPYVAVAWHASGVQTLADLKQTELIFGGTATKDPSYIAPMILKRMFGYKTSVVLGYKDDNETNALQAAIDGHTPNELDRALERGEVSARVATWSKPAGAVAQDVFPLVQWSAHSSPLLARVPLIQDLARTDEERNILKLLVADTEIGNTLSLPPNVDKDRLNYLRQAFADLLVDPAFLTDAKILNVDLEPMSGEDILGLVNATLKTDGAIVAKAKALLE